MAKSKKQTEEQIEKVRFLTRDRKTDGLKWMKRKVKARVYESTPGRGVHRGPKLPDWFRNTETLDEVSDLLDRCVRLDEVVNKPKYHAEAIERMVRVRVKRFRIAGKNLPELPKSIDLQDWQIWFTDLKATPTATDNSGGKVETGKANKIKRKTKSEKIAEIAAHLKEQPYATSPDIEKATDIDESDVRRLWGPIKKELREGKRDKPSGSKGKGNIEAEDKSASCGTCRAPINHPFECKLCNDIIKGECKTCHSTNTHTDDAIP